MPSVSHITMLGGIMMLVPVIRLCVPAIKMNIIHRQARKLGSLSTVEVKPLIMPTPMPTNTATGMAVHGAMYLAASVAQAQANPMAAPIEKSRLPVAITKTAAVAAINKAKPCLKIRIRLMVVSSLPSETIWKTTTRTNKPRKGMRRLINSLIRSRAAAFTNAAFCSSVLFITVSMAVPFSIVILKSCNG